MIQRQLTSIIEKKLSKKKALIIMGARQVGKSTLLNMLFKDSNLKILFLDGDEPDIREMLSSITSTQLKMLIGNAGVVVIDEAQRIKNIGITLKLIVDKIPNVHLIVSGSSALELAGGLNEPLTGRKYEFQLMPLSTQEMINHHGFLEEKRLLNHRLVFGFYPDIVMNPGDEQINLKNLVNSYLYKDVFSFRDVRKPEIVEKLIKAIALQLGSEVSYNELAQITGCDTATVQRYIDLMEKTYIVFRLPSLSRNVRNELKKSRKIYFYDNGIRNAVIGNLNNISLRNDIGALWENFLVSERRKFLENNQMGAESYFWRTKQQQEIDLIEDLNGHLNAFEFKWNSEKEGRFPKTFREAYPNHTSKTIHPDNYLEFLTATAD